MRRVLILIAMLATASTASASLVTSLDDITFWVGTGTKRAALVIDWNDGRDPLAWGYRWDGTKSGEDMLKDIAGAEFRLFAKIAEFGFGDAVIGFGYDRNDNGFALDDDTEFTAGIAITGTSDGVQSVDPQDSYQEGWNTGFWGYYVADGLAYPHGAWGVANSGMGDEILADGEWNGWSFAPGFNFTPPGGNIGDADLDGDVDGSDFDLWRTRPGYTGPGTGTWGSGDFDHDGDVDGADFDLWRLRPPQYPSNVTGVIDELVTVPEPSTLALLGIGGLFMLARRRTI